MLPTHCMYINNFFGEFLFSFLKNFKYKHAQISLGSVGTKNLFSFQTVIKHAGTVHIKIKINIFFFIFFAISKYVNGPREQTVFKVFFQHFFLRYKRFARTNNNEWLEI